MSIEELHLPVVSNEPRHENTKPPFVLDRWVCSWQSLVVHAAICTLLIFWTKHVSGLPGAQIGTVVYGPYPYHVFRLMLIVYALVSFAIAYVAGLNGLMSGKAMMRALWLCIVFIVLWLGSFLFVSSISQDRSMFATNRALYPLEKGRVYVKYSAWGESGNEFYSVSDCDRFEIVCEVVGSNSYSITYYGFPVRNDDPLRYTYPRRYEEPAGEDIILPGVRRK